MQTTWLRNLVRQAIESAGPDGLTLAEVMDIFDTQPRDGVLAALQSLADEAHVAESDRWRPLKKSYWKMDLETIRATSKLFPLPDADASEILSAFVGHPPHEMRHLCFQLAQRAGSFYNDDHVQPAGGLHPSPVVYAHAYTDHGVGGAEDALAAIYNDRSSERAIELLSLRIGPILWELLTGDLGSHKEPDMDAIKSTYLELRANEADLNALPAQYEKLRQTPTLRRPERICAQAPSPQATPAEKLDFVIAQNHRLSDALTHVMNQNDELRDIVLQSGQILFEAHRLAEQRAVLVRTLDELRLDDARWLRVPDDQPFEPVNWRDLELDQLGHLIADGTNTLLIAAIRDYLTAAELREIADLANRSTISRWMNGQHLPAADRRPWEADAIPVEPLSPDGRNRNYRRIWVPGIRAGFWQTKLMRQRCDELLATFPQGQGWRRSDGSPSPRCLAPLVMPEPFASRYAQEHGASAGYPLKREMDADALAA